jgi:hypothetical protein
MERDTNNLPTVLTELALLPLRVGLAALDMLSARHARPRSNEANGSALTSIGEAEIEAAAVAIKSKLIRGHDVGFQDMLRTNLPDDIVLEVARAALEAARDARTGT